MSIFVSWVVFPLLLGALSLGCGLLLEYACRTRLPGTLLAPVGLSVVIVAGVFMTMTDATAELAAPLVVGLAVAGFAFSSPARLREVDGWALAAALGALGAFAAPIVFSGEATFAGYVRLDDTSAWFAITDVLMDRGRDLDGLPLSGFELTVNEYIDNGYPVGSFLPLGIGSVLLDRDVAWLFQPVIAFYAAMLALGLYTLVSRLVDSRPLSALVAFVASQPALLFAYSLLGGIKEVAAAAVLVTLPVLLLYVIGREVRWRTLAAPAMACAAVLAILSLGGAVWLVAPLVAALVIVVIRRDLELPTIAWRVGAFAGFTLLFAIPTLIESSGFFSAGSRQTLSSGSELGILEGPLNTLQVLGIWPADDFRVDPDQLGITYALLALLAIGAAAGVAYAWMRRAWGPLLLLSGAIVGSLISAFWGSPWVDAKAFSIASSTFVLFGLLGAVALVRATVPALGAYSSVRLVAAAFVAVLLAGGVLWSNVLAYTKVNLAPGDRMEELRQIGEDITGEGPTLMTEPEIYLRHFLRGAEADAASLIFRRPVFLKSGRTLTSFVVRAGNVERGFADIDRFRVQSVLVFKTLVLRRTPVGSRPPAAYRLVSRGRYYEVWQRPDTPSRPTIEHLSLGSRLEATGRPRCRDVRRLARRAGPGGVLATVRRKTALVASQMIEPTDDFTLGSRFIAPETARYGVWLGGAGFHRRVEISVDGRGAGVDRHRLSNPRQYHPFGAVELTRGTHVLTLKYGPPDLHPGTAGSRRTIGPVVLSRGTAAQPVSLVSPSRASSLCGQRLDWVEALGS